jgi:mannose-1-phosphate guanylyltransferase
MARLPYRVKALVLIGGFGTRLRPVTYSVPKQLIPIAGKPMLYHVLDILPPDVEEVVLATGYKSEQIDAFVQAHPTRWPIRIVPEAEPLGTGGGMKNAAAGMSDPFFLLNSDVITHIELASVAALHQRRGGIGVMVLVEVDDTRPYGVAALGSDDRITQFIEKPEPQDAPSRWINAGLAVWRGEVLDRIPPGKPVSFEREVVPGLIDSGVFGFRLVSYWDDAGTPERLLRSQRLLFDDGRAPRTALPPGALGRGPVAAPPGTDARGASFGPYVTLGSGVSVDAGAHVENSVLMDGVRVEREAFVSGSILGPKVRIRQGRRVTRQVVGEGVEV